MSENQLNINLFTIFIYYYYVRCVLHKIQFKLELILLYREKNKILKYYIYKNTANLNNSFYANYPI